MYPGRKAISALGFNNPLDDQDFNQSLLVPKRTRDRHTAIGRIGLNDSRAKAKSSASDDMDVLGSKKWKSSILLMEVKLKEMMDKAAEGINRYKNSSLLGFCMTILKELENTSSSSDEHYIYSSLIKVFDDCLYVSYANEDNPVKIPYFACYTKERERE